MTTPAAPPGAPRGAQRAALVIELTALILEAAEKTLDGATLSADEPIFGPDARLALDSLDALQVSMALQKRYGVRLTDSKETRRILSCVGNLADYLLNKRA
jgi:acyl carrier protein